MKIEPIVELKKVNKFYGENQVVKELDMEIREGEFLSILGPSGCGKTTILRMIAGFEQQTSGVITVQGEHIESKEPFERDVNTVFQSYSLFPHMSVYDNIAYGLKMKKKPKSEIKGEVNKALTMVRLEGYGKRYPHQLSGGQRQRVAIARAIINNPKVLLLDEPLGALDMKLRKQMQIELKNLQKKLGITFVFVTHDQEEALTMSDRIAVMNGGILDQVDTPSAIYERPATKFVADFIGETNLFEAVAEKQLSDKLTRYSTEEGHFAAESAITFKAGKMHYVSVRPEKVLASKEEVPNFNLCGTVIENIYLGSSVKSIVALTGGQEIKIVTQSGQEIPEIKSLQYIYWKDEDAVLLESSSNQILDVLGMANLSLTAKTTEG